MTRQSFNEGWAFKPKTSIWAQLAPGGAPAEPVTLPHDALIAAPRSADASGKTAYFPTTSEYEYVKELDVPEEWRTRRVSLEFQGAYRDAMVFVNGVRAAHWPNGYRTMRVALDDFLAYGERNTLKVEVRAHNDSRWYSGVGIFRDVVLIVTDLVHLAADGIAVTTPDVDDERAVVDIAVPVTNAGVTATTVRVETSVLDAGADAASPAVSPLTLRAGETAVVRHRMYVRNPKRWSVDHPHLYDVRTSVREADRVRDAETVPLGIRTLQLDPFHGLRINGEPVKLRGACVHHDNGPLGAAGIGRAEERRVELLKAAGFNAIRSAHNPLSQAMLDACDRLGMLVMDEAFDAWTESKNAFDYSLAFEDWWERDLAAMVRKDRNHPSVVFYSIGNEIPETGSPIGANWGRKLAEKIRQLDDTRFVTNAVNGFVSVISDVVAMMAQHVAESGDSAGDTPAGGVNAAGNLMGQIIDMPMVAARIEEALTQVDVAGLNYGERRYEKDRDTHPNRIVIGTETFPQAIAANWRLVQDNPHVLGDFTWTGWDYLGEVGIGRLRYADEESRDLEAPYPWLTAWCGDLDITGHRRPQSYYREIVFGLRAEPYIAVDRPGNRGRERSQMLTQWSWPDAISSWTWDVKPGTPLDIEVYSDAPEVELHLNGRTLGRAPAGPDHAFRAAFTAEYEPGELVAVAYHDGVETSRTTLASATDDVTLTVKPDRTHIDATDRELAYVAIELRDTHGTLGTDRDLRVHVEVTGAGVLQALGSGRPDSTEAFTADTCTTFDGRALAVVRPTAPGEITVTVTADGHADTTVTLFAG